MLVTEWESKYIYFSKQELEWALGVDLNSLPVRKLPSKQNEIISDRLLKPDNNQQNEITRLRTENTLLKAKIAELNEQLRAMQEVDNGGKVATLSEYEGELPPKTDADKLADFIELVFNPDLLDNGKIPTYSRLHTKLTAKYRDRKITAKNTIKKYLNQF